MPIHIAILSPIPLIREGLRALLAQEPDFRVTALDPADDWFEELLAQNANVLMLDAQVLEREGWDALADVHRALPDLTLILLGDSAQDRRAAYAFERGARGYILRDTGADEMAHALRAAHSGSLVMHPQLMTQFLETAARARVEEQNAPHQEEQALVEPLSARELDVLRLMTRGLANKQIAAELFITEHTVKFHIRAILGKLGAANRTEAVTLALARGLVNL